MMLCAPRSRFFSFFLYFFFSFLFTLPHLNHATVRCNMCVIVSPSACFIVHTSTSVELPLISGVSESPQHRRLLPAGFLNAFLLRAALCPSDSSSFSTSSFTIPMGINGLRSLATPKALSFSADENKLNESENLSDPLNETRKWANRANHLSCELSTPQQSVCDTSQVWSGLFFHYYFQMTQKEEVGV